MSTATLTLQPDKIWASMLARPYLCLALIALLLFFPGLVSLPPLDRDESRFAQATAQMLETRDFVQIRFLNQPFPSYLEMEPFQKDAGSLSIRNSGFS